MQLTALVLVIALAIALACYRLWREQVRSLIREAEKYANSR